VWKREREIGKWRVTFLLFSFVECRHFNLIFRQTGFHKWSRLFLTAAGCPRNGFYTPSPSRLLRAKILSTGHQKKTKTPAKRWLNLNQKAAKLEPKNSTARKKVYTACICTVLKKIFTAYLKKTFVLQKITFLLPKIAISPFSGTLSQLLAHFLSFWYTSSAFGTLP